MPGDQRSLNSAKSAGKAGATPALGSVPFRAVPAEWPGRRAAVPVRQPAPRPSSAQGGMGAKDRVAALARRAPQVDVEEHLARAPVPNLRDPDGGLPVPSQVLA